MKNFLPGANRSDLTPHFTLLTSGGRCAQNLKKIFKNKTKKVVAKNEKFYFEAGDRNRRYYPHRYPHYDYNGFVRGLLMLAMWTLNVS